MRNECETKYVYHDWILYQRRCASSDSNFASVSSSLLSRQKLNIWHSWMILLERAHMSFGIPQSLANSAFMLSNGVAYPTHTHPKTFHFYLNLNLKQYKCTKKSKRLTYNSRLGINVSMKRKKNARNDTF